MNKEFVKDVYRRIGLNENSIDARIKQAEMLAKTNSDPWEKSGGGMQFAFDSITGKSLDPIIVKDQEEAKLVSKQIMQMYSMANDADTTVFNPSSSGVPAPLLTIWSSRAIEQMYKKTTLSQLAGSWQQGSFGVEQVKVPVIGMEGFPTLYNDLSSTGNTAINVTWINRDTVYLEQTLVWGDMQQAKFGLAKIDYVNRLREAMAITVAQYQNDIGFNGYVIDSSAASTIPFITGIINDPNLRAAISLPNDGTVPGTSTATTAWSGKDFEKTTRDVRLLVSQVISNAGGHASTDGRFILATPPSAETALLTPNSFGISVKAYLKQAFPKIEFVTVPNFESQAVTAGAQIGKTVVMVLFEKENGEMPFDELFVTKWQGHRPFAMSSSVSEKISYGLAGTICKYPYLVSYAYGC